MPDVISPKSTPDLAAQQAVLALIEAKTFGQHREHAVSDAESAEKVAQAIIKTHELLAAYYRTLTE